MPYSILLVDDDNEFRSEFRDILEGEYTVIEAANGSDALKIIKEPNMIDLVIMDERMPGRRGTEILKEMKEYDPYLIIIMLTGYGSKEIIIKALRAHADDFLEKPIKIKPALATIKNLLKNKYNALSNTIERIKVFIDKNYHKNISLRDVAEFVYLSPKYVSRLFKENFGMNFHEYKLRCRINKAKDLLKKTGLTVNEISYKCGYRNVESFVRMFKKMTGNTPGSYRLHGKE